MMMNHIVECIEELDLPMNRIESFEELCAALRRNDPDTTEIPDLFQLTIPYGRSLGEALQGNHYVSSMHLDLNNLLDADDEGTDSVALLLR